ncbi:MAG: response regulator [Pirellulales bacterium]|nr:response regulator [Pirellulales bacterium]
MTYRALVVDDSPEILEVVGDVLCSLGHEFDTATCQDEARKLLTEHQYSYHLLDLEIPVRPDRGFARIQNGENLLREIAARRNGRREPILVMTGHGTDSPKLAVQMMKLGADDYITKPFATVGRTLDRAILEALEGAGHRPKRGTAKTTPSTTGEVSLEPFAGGELVLSPYRAELAGAVVWRERPEMLIRRVLGALAETHPSGRYFAFSGLELAAKVGCSGEANKIAGAIRDFRQEVIRVLREEGGIHCTPQDVIQSGGAGYRFKEWIVVRSGDVVTGTAPGSGGGTDVPDVPDHVPDGPDHGTDDPAVRRRRWIVGELSKGRHLRAPGIATELNVSYRTVKRDLDALRSANRIAFVGPARTGYYRIKTPGSRT